MTLAAGALALLRRGIADPDTQWSLGTFGAIAEFSRDEDEPAQVSMAAGMLSAITEHGGIALRQMKAAGEASPALAAWLANLDQGNLDQADDEAALHGG